MKFKITVLVIVLISAGFFLLQARKMHESFMGNPPQNSTPYNVLDYTKSKTEP